MHFFKHFVPSIFFGANNAWKSNYICQNRANPIQDIYVKKTRMQMQWCVSCMWHFIYNFSFSHKIIPPSSLYWLSIFVSTRRKDVFRRPETDSHVVAFTLYLPFVHVTLHLLAECNTLINLIVSLNKWRLRHEYSWATHNAANENLPVNEDFVTKWSAGHSAPFAAHNK